VFGGPDVKCAIKQHLEAKATARPDVRHAQAARLALREDDVADAGQLGEGTRPGAELVRRVVTAKDPGHGGGRLL
jgi:hypothetical protein